MEMPIFVNSIINHLCVTSILGERENIWRIKALTVILCWGKAKYIIISDGDKNAASTTDSDVLLFVIFPVQVNN